MEQKMDEERMPKELVNKIIIIFLVIVLQAILLSYFREAGSIFVFMIILFMLIFSAKDRKLKKQHENYLLKEHDWYKSKYNLTKDIP